jgi:hypothetical protein
VKRALIIALMLVGCTKPAIRVETVTVKIPVAVACVDQSALAKVVDPARVTFTGNAEADVRIATAQGLRLWEVVNDLRAVMTGCIK